MGRKNIWGVDILDSKDPSDKKSVLYRKSVQENVLADSDENSNMNPRLLYRGTYEGQGSISGEVVKNKEGKWVVTDKQYRWIWINNEWKKQDIVVTYSQLKTIFNRGLDVHLKNLETEINLNYTKYELSNFNIIAHFFGQISQETGGLTNSTTVENGNYSSLERVGIIFKTTSSVYAKTKENPDYYLNNGEHFFNMAYANKNGNGNEESGDGYKYRGRGYIQLSGKENYSTFNDFYNDNFFSNKDFLLNPEPIGEDNKVAMISALFYFWKHTIKVIHKINHKGNNITDSEFKAITRTINAAEVDWEKRKQIYLKSYNELHKPI